MTSAVRPQSRTVPLGPSPKPSAPETEQCPGVVLTVVLSSAARGTVDWSRLDNSAVHRHVTACAKT